MIDLTLPTGLSLSVGKLLLGQERGGKIFHRGSISANVAKDKLGAVVCNGHWLLRLLPDFLASHDSHKACNAFVKYIGTRSGMLRKCGTDGVLERDWKYTYNSAQLTLDDDAILPPFIEVFPQAGSIYMSPSLELGFSGSLTGAHLRINMGLVCDGLSTAPCVIVSEDRLTLEETKLASCVTKDEPLSADLRMRAYEELLPGWITAVNFAYLLGLQQMGLEFLLPVPALIQVALSKLPKQEEEARDKDFDVMLPDGELGCYRLEENINPLIMTHRSEPGAIIGMIMPMRL